MKKLIKEILYTAHKCGVCHDWGDVVVEGNGAGDASFRLLNKGASRMGDRSGAIRAWVMHSTTMHNLFDNALTNTENLFRYDGVNVIRDPFGRLFVVTDAPALAVANETDTIYNTLGLVEGAIVVNDSNDFNAELRPITGGENIEYEYQAEWTYGVGVKGFAWDMAAGGKSPTDSAIGTPTNWNQIATSLKDTAGVLVKSK